MHPLRHPRNAALVGIAFVVILLAVSALPAWESARTIRHGRARGRSKSAIAGDATSLDHVTRKIHAIRIPPMIALPASGIEETPYRNEARPGESSSMPKKSNVSDGCGWSLGSTMTAKMNATTPIGRLSDGGE